MRVPGFGRHRCFWFKAEWLEVCAPRPSLRANGSRFGANPSQGARGFEVLRLVAPCSAPGFEVLCLVRARVQGFGALEALEAQDLTRVRSFCANWRAHEFRSGSLP